MEFGPVQWGFVAMFMHLMAIVFLIVFAVSPTNDNTLSLVEVGPLRGEGIGPSISVGIFGYCYRDNGSDILICLRNLNASVFNSIGDVMGATLEFSRMPAFVIFMLIITWSGAISLPVEVYAHSLLKRFDDDAARWYKYAVYTGLPTAFVAVLTTALLHNWFAKTIRTATSIIEKFQLSSQLVVRPGQGISLAWVSVACLLLSLLYSAFMWRAELSRLDGREEIKQMTDDRVVQLTGEVNHLRAENRVGVRTVYIPQNTGPTPPAPIYVGRAPQRGHVQQVESGDEIDDGSA